MDQSLCYWEQVPPYSREGTHHEATWVFSVCDHGEGMKKWEGKPTSALAAEVCELKGRTTTKCHSSFQSVLRQNRRAGVTFSPLEGTFSLYLQEVNSSLTRVRGVFHSARSFLVQGKGTIRSIGLCGCHGLGSSDSQEYWALVDTRVQCTLMPSRY